MIDTTGSTATPIGVYSASAFVAGQTVTPPPLDAYPGNGPETIDPSGNLFSEATFAAAGIEVILNGSHTPSATAMFVALFMAPVTH